VISIEEMTPRRQAEAIQAGLLDIGYSPDHSALRQPELCAEKTGEWGMLVAMADDHPLASVPEITLAMLAHEALILYEAHDADERLSLLLAKALGDQLNIAHRTGSSLNVLAIAASGLGVALVPVPLRQVSVPGLIYRALNAPELTANLLVISRKKESSPAVKAWLAQVNDRGD